MTRGPRWTAEEVNKLRDCAARNLTPTQTAEVVGRSAAACLGKAATLELSLAKESRLRRCNREVEETLQAAIPPAPRYASRTAMIFGDPPIGRSALDQKRAGQ